MQVSLKIRTRWRCTHQSLEQVNFRVATESDPNFVRV